MSTYQHKYGYSNGKFTEGDEVTVSSDGNQQKYKVVGIAPLIVASMTGRKINWSESWEVSADQVTVIKSAPVKTTSDSPEDTATIVDSKEKKNDNQETETLVEKASKTAKQSFDKVSDSIKEINDKTKQKVRDNKKGISLAQPKLNKKGKKVTAQVEGKLKHTSHQVTVFYRNKKKNWKQKTVTVNNNAFKTRLKLKGKGPWSVFVKDESSNTKSKKKKVS
jgi:hypothetical protein